MYVLQTLPPPPPTTPAPTIPVCVVSLPNEPKRLPNQWMETHKVHIETHTHHTRTRRQIIKCEVRSTEGDLSNIRTILCEWNEWTNEYGKKYGQTYLWIITLSEHCTKQKVTCCIWCLHLPQVVRSHRFWYFVYTRFLFSCECAESNYGFVDRLCSVQC